MLAHVRGHKRSLPYAARLVEELQRQGSSSVRVTRPFSGPPRQARDEKEREREAACWNPLSVGSGSAVC